MISPRNSRLLRCTKSKKLRKDLLCSGYGHSVCLLTASRKNGRELVDSLVRHGRTPTSRMYWIQRDAFWEEAPIARIVSVPLASGLARSQW